MGATFTYEAVLSSIDYDVLARREIEDRLRVRLGRAALPPQNLVPEGVRDPAEHAAVTEIIAKSARIVVVLHQRLWGETDSTRADAEAIRQRMRRSGTEFLQVLSLDSAPLPQWLREAPQVDLVGASIDAAVEPIVQAVIDQGGTPRGDQVAADARTAGAATASRESASFLASHRAQSTVTRELGKLGDDIEKRIGELVPEGDEAAAEVTRTPGRVSVQMGPVALTISWLRERTDSPGGGRLLIIEWRGRIGSRGRPLGTQPAVPVREYTLRAEATRSEDWRWRSEEAAVLAYSTSDLAALCVDSVKQTLAEDRA